MSYSKYYLYKKQVSNDGGVTWADVTPLETAPSGNPIATYATLEECNGQSPSYSGQYLTFVAQESGTFTFAPTSSNAISYSLDSGSTWTQGNSVSVSSGQKVMWKGTMTPSTSDPYGIGTFSSTSNFTVEGNPMSLLFGDNFSGQTDLTGKNYAFARLFIEATTLTSAENLSLPATTLSSASYVHMFGGCSSLTTAPQLPATTLNGWGCYALMFSGCTSLITAPELPATTLANSCYGQMFEGCTSLTTAPQLPATTLASNCYGNMFQGCSSLTTAPQLLATTLSTQCYASMFWGCTSLTTAPNLPATTLANYCYKSMFRGCTSLSAITCLATDISASQCTNNWVKGVASSGTFIRDCNTQWSTGESGIPNNWQDNCSTPQYRTTSGTPYCQEFDKYVDVYSQVSYDSGETWTTTATTATLIEHNSEDCGYIAPQYRTTSGTPYCSGYDKYVDVYSQVSYDSGSTWTTTATTPTLIEADSPDCGYVPSSFELASYISEAHYISDTLTGTIYGTNGFSASFEHSSVSATQTLVDNIEGTLSTYGYVMDSNYNTIEPYKAITKTLTITTIEGIRYTITLNIGKGLKGRLTTLKN